MQTPKRRIGKYAHLMPDQHITLEKYKKLEAEYLKLKKFVRPPAIEEVKRLALMGDFSENAAYQIAKGRLRGINQRLIDIENMLKRSEIINTNPKSQIVSLGTTVTIELDNKLKTYQILGSTETDPLKGIISHNSPIGKALMNRKINEQFKIKIKDKEMDCKIISIN